MRGERRRCVIQTIHAHHPLAVPLFSTASRHGPNGWGGMSVPWSPDDWDHGPLPVSSRTGEKSRAERTFSISVVGPSVASAVLENVGLTVYREEDRALVECVSWKDALVRG